MSNYTQYPQSQMTSGMTSGLAQSSSRSMTSSMSYAARPTAAAAGAGALVGGILALARDVRKVKKGEMTKGAATRDVLLESAGTGLATGVGGAVASMVAAPGLLSLAVLVAAGAGVKYAWDGMVQGGCCCGTTASATAETAAAQEEAPKAKKK